MRFAVRFGIVSTLGAVLCMSSFGTRIATRPSSGYGDPLSITVVDGQGNPLMLTSGGFTQTVVCGGGNTMPLTPNTACAVDPNNMMGTAGFFDLLVNVPSLSAGTLINFNLDGTAFNSTAQEYGLLTVCDSGNLGALCTTSAALEADANCVNSIFNGWGGSGAALSLTVPSCATNGFSVVFDETKPSFATISTSSPVGTPEPRTIVLLGAGLLAFAFLYKKN